MSCMSSLPTSRVHLSLRTVVLGSDGGHVPCEACVV